MKTGIQSTPQGCADRGRKDELIARFELDFPGFALGAALHVPAGVIAVVGPSGSGKTTLLRCMAGLQRGGRGYFQVCGSIWRDDANGISEPVHRRGVGYVFQDTRLFPHMNVRANLSYGLKRMSSSRHLVAWDQVVTILEIGELLDRRPHDLSGGETQRVAIARTLLGTPRLLLMDEPLAALDIARKKVIVPYLVRLNREFHIPVVYVSHSVEEVVQVADTLVVMDKGEAVAAGAIADICSQPALAGYMGEEIGGVLESRVESHDADYNLTLVSVDGQRLFVPRQSASVGERLRIHVHSRDITLATAPPDVNTSALNVLHGRVEGIHESGHPHAVLIKLNAGGPLLAKITRKSLDTLKLRPGQEVYAYIKTVMLG